MKVLFVNIRDWELAKRAVDGDLCLILERLLRDGDAFHRYVDMSTVPDLGDCVFLKFERQGGKKEALPYTVIGRAFPIPEDNGGMVIAKATVFVHSSDDSTEEEEDGSQS